MIQDAPTCNVSRVTRSEKGVTLIELLVVCAIIGILAIALAFNYQGWVGNYKIESQTKQLYADLMEARTRALTRNFTYLASATSGGYLVVEDSDSSGTITGPDSCFWGTPPCQAKTLDSGYKLKSFNGGFPTSAAPLTINTRGLISGVAMPWYVGIDSTNYNPDYDCIIVTQDSIRMGKWNGGASCAEK